MNKPSSTITAATLGGVLSTVVVWVLNSYALLPVVLGPAEGAAIATITAMIVGYFKKENVIGQ